jgi:hypothetical protein
VYDTAGGYLELTAKIASFDAGEGAQAGMMMRSSTDPGEAHAYVHVDHLGLIFFSWRAAEGQENNTVQIAVPESGQVWLKLIRFGNSLSAGYSLDGMVFIISVSQTVELPETFLVGPATSASLDESYVYADYMYITAHPPMITISGSSSP